MNETPPIPQKLPRLHVLFTETWQLYQQRFLVLVGIAVVPAALGFVGGLFLPVFVPLAIAMFIAAVVFYLAMVVALVHALDNPAADPLAAYRFAFRRLHSYLWLTILVNLITIGALVLAIIPGFLVSVWLIFSLFTFVIEGRRGMSALVASREYVRGYWWAVFGRFLLAAFVVGGASVMLGALFGDFDQPFARSATSAIAQALFTALALPLFAAYLYRLFTHVRTLKSALAGAAMPAKRGFFIFCAILGLVAPIIALLAAGAIILATLGALILSQPPYNTSIDEGGDAVADVSAWNTYDLGPITFKYPPGWTIENIYYQTPAAQEQEDEPQVIGLRLFPGNVASDSDFIDIGGRQVDCETAGHTRCFLIPAIDNFTFTDSSNPAILSAFDTLISTIEKSK